MTDIEKIEKLERIARLGQIFVIDARGSWETQEGELLLELFDEYNTSKIK